MYRNTIVKISNIIAAINIDISPIYYVYLCFSTYIHMYISHECLCCFGCMTSHVTRPILLEPKKRNQKIMAGKKTKTLIIRPSFWNIKTNFHTVIISSINFIYGKFQFVKLNIKDFLKMT